MAKTTSSQVFFCTYRNRETENAWRKSKEYPSMAALTSAMTSYLEKWPSTLVQFQTRTVYAFEEQK